MANVNYNDNTPVPPPNFGNAHFQFDANGNISINVPLSRNVVLPGTDYSMTPSDQVVIATTGCTTVYLPANPVNNQLVTIKDYSQVPSITINGNGHQINGPFPTQPLYIGQTLTLWAGTDQNWRPLDSTSSQWLPYTPTISAAGAMTVTGQVANISEWLFLNFAAVMYRLNLNFTLGGTPSNQVIISSPLLSRFTGLLLGNPCWMQEPGFAQVNSSQYYFRADATLGFILRRMDNTNFTPGAYVFETQGWYRTA